MRISRSAILFILGVLTIFFLGSSYALWFNNNLIPFTATSGELPTPLAAATAGVEDNPPNAVRLTIMETGIVAIKAEQLADAGLSFDELSSTSFSLSRNSQEVPFLVHGDTDSPTLFFYAQASDNPLEPLSVYMLRSGQGTAINSRDASPNGPGSTSGFHLFKWEEDRFFVQHAGGEDVWMGPSRMAPDKWTYRLDEINVDTGLAELTLHLFSNREGPNEPDHHVVIQVNEQTIANHAWDGIQHEIISVPLVDGILNAGDENIITLIIEDKSNISSETIYINELNLAYQGPLSLEKGQITFTSDADNIVIKDAESDALVFDITNYEAPVYLTNMQTVNDSVHFSGSNARSEYIALEQSQTAQVTIETVPTWANSLRDAGWGADYIAVVADVTGFEEAINPLLAYRQDQDLRVLTVPVEQIYDEFGGGHKSPAAIKTFLAYAAAHWTPPAPRYVLLVGDATYDLTDQTPGKNRNLLPTALIHTNLGGIVASDSWFGQFTGGLPPMVIGRFPAQNAPQLRVMVDKTLTYEQNVDVNDNIWRARALLVADDESVFDDATIALTERLNDNGFRVYGLQMSYDERIHYNILSAINQGVGLVNYYGRGSKGTWGDEVVLQSTDAQTLYNGTRLPILTSFTTQNGAFAEPRIDAITESLLRANNGGVVAAIAPSGRASNEQLLLLGKQFYERLLNGEGGRIGDVLDSLRQSDTADPSRADALTTINLLGDPALKLYTP